MRPAPQAGPVGGACLRHLSACCLLERLLIDTNVELESVPSSASNSDLSAARRAGGPAGEEGYTGALLFDVPALVEGCRQLRCLALIVGVPHNQPNGLRSEAEVLEELGGLPCLEEVRPPCEW